VSPGILAYRKGDDGPQVLLVHPGGPFWLNKDGGAWSTQRAKWRPWTIQSGRRDVSSPRNSGRAPLLGGCTN
jgi:predicted NUDIX family NTP pyrophosphohydrolase